MVTVTLSEASKEDADAVLGVLRTAFRGAEPGAPQDQPTGRPVVWTAEFDATEKGTQAGPTALTGSVAATVQGGHVAVDQVCDALSMAFAVEGAGTAAGDQEKEVDLRLRGKG
nr:hypothetical protein OG461_06705 [Streptomyces sp. NBC_00995]